jgi:hypothetical protein
MNGSLWNSNGFKDPAKHSVVHEAIRNFWLDFFAVLETGRHNFLAPFLKNLSKRTGVCLVLFTTFRSFWWYSSRI